MNKIEYKLYEVGGKIRDDLLGLHSNDIDYSVVVEDKYLDNDPKDVFDLLAKDLKEKGFKIFLETSDVFTIRAKFPDTDPNAGDVADFVLSRKEIEYTEGTRRPIVTLGTLYDDLERRDFTINAMAREKESGQFIDPFNGQQDLQDRILRTTGDASISFKDDPLRILRALRFSITKEFDFSDQIIDAIRMFPLNRMTTVSMERIREELTKMFRHDTLITLYHLEVLRKWNHELFIYLFKDRELWLNPTLKSR